MEIRGVCIMVCVCVIHFVHKISSLNDFNFVVLVLVKIYATHNRKNVAVVMETRITPKELRSDRPLT